MPAFKKTILKVRKYESPDGDVVVTPERLAHWAKQHARLKKNDQTVPVDWDHVSDPSKAVPLSSNQFKKHRSSKNSVGFLDNFRVSKDGKSAEIIMDVRRKSACEAADNNTVFVSPVIQPEWKDGRGNVYKDVITHVDFVNHPVDDSQSPFEPVGDGAIACAIRLGLETSKDGKPLLYRMANGDDEDEDEDDDDDDKEEKELDDDESDDELEDFLDDDIIEDDEEEDFLDDLLDEPVQMQDVPPAPAPAPPQPAQPDAESAALAAQVRSDLLEAGITAPEGVDPIHEPADFLRQLCAALRQKAMDERDGEAEEDSVLEPTSDEPAFGGADMGKPTVTSPDVTALQLDLQKTKRQLEAAHKREERSHRLSLQQRAEELVRTGRATPEMLKNRQKQLDAVRLSLDDNGIPRPTQFQLWVESLEELPAGCVWPGEAKKLSLVEPPEDIDGVLSAEDVKKFVDQQADRMPGVIAK